MLYSDYKIKKIKFEDKTYPKILKDIKDPPRVLYYRGSLKKALLKKSLAVVGSRKMTRYGAEAVERFVADLVSEKVTTISGFMYGVDTEVHQKTVEYGGRTIAVFGCGLNVIYPPENKDLYTKILENGGAVISEYEPKAKPHLWKFPQRNRIVAGLASLGVLVIEGGAKSGSLLTAKIALDQGKKVYAIPGPITSKVSTGPNNLIKSEKAILAQSVGDILRYRVKKTKEKSRNFQNNFERKIYEALENEGLTIDEISRALGDDVTKISTTISMMALKGIITESGGKYYIS